MHSCAYKVIEEKSTFKDLNCYPLSKRKIRHSAKYVILHHSGRKMRGNSCEMKFFHKLHTSAYECIFTHLRLREYILTSIIKSSIKSHQNHRPWIRLSKYWFYHHIQYNCIEMLTNLCICTSPYFFPMQLQQNTSFSIIRA